LSTLILTEKPSVARDFAKALEIPARGEGSFSDNSTIITWAIGHLYVPFDPENYDSSHKKWSLEGLPIVPDRFNYRANKRTQKQLNIILKLLKSKNISKVIVATDAGREGELIARTILAHSKYSGPSFRFWTSDALTSQVILDQMNNLKPLKDYDRLYYAGKARQVADWLIGMNLTRAVSVLYGDLFSVGRVQTAVLSLLVKRKNEIENFIPELYNILDGEFNFSGKVIKAKWFNPKLKDKSDWIVKEDDLKSLISKCHKKEAVITSNKTQRKSTATPLLYSLTELQKHANRLYGFSAKKTLSLAQDLYEKYKCLSYPRTDSQYLGRKSFDLATKLINDFSKSDELLFSKLDEKKISVTNRRVFYDEGLTDHHALIPLKKFNGQRSSDHGKIHFLVLKRFAAAFSKDHIYDETKIIIECEKENFKTRGKVIVEQGFKEIVGIEKEFVLPKVNEQDVGQNVSLKPHKKETKPPAHYTDATLLHHMSNPGSQLEDKDLRNVFNGNIGLGTQATRASIIETLLKRQYVNREARNLIATHKGVHLIDLLKKLPFSGQLVKADETAKWEFSLEEMAKGDLELGKGFVDSMKLYTKNCINELKQSDKINYIQKENSSKRVNKSNSSENSIGVCPLCKGDIIENAKAFGCSNWRSGCKVTVWKRMSGKRISAAQVKKLLKNGKTDQLKGFKSKQGKVFDAHLILNESGVNFEF